MANDKIVIKGAREHNLKNVNLTLPREKLIVMTGLSGSGKSSLAFDTIYADGQRRYVESLSSYARMFLGRMDKPDVDEITGLSPAISIDQKTTSHNPRSTVGTVTEIYDYLRLLYARVGVPHCPVCGRVISQQTVDEMVDAVLKLDEGTKFQVLAPVVRQRKGTQQKELDAARRGGYARVKIDGNLYDLDEEIKLEKNIKHTVEIVVDRLAMRKGIRGRLADSLETALALTGGIAEVDVIGGDCMTFSQNFACPEHGISISDLSPRLFSFNNPLGACEKCTGLGTFMRVDEERILPNRNLSIREGAIKASGWYYAEGSVSEMYYLGLGKKYGFTLDTPIKEMSTEAVNALLYGTNGEKIEMHRTNEFGSGVYYNTFEGIVENLERRFRETNSEWMKEEIGSFMSGVECPDCHGKRLKPVVLAVTIGGKAYTGFKAQVNDDGTTTYTIPGADVTGNIVINSNKQVKLPETYKVTFAGTGAGDATGESTVQEKANYTFTVAKQKNFEYTITATMGGKDVTITEGADNTYTIANVTGDLVITIEKKSTLTMEVAVSEYVQMDNKTVFLVTVTGIPEEGKAFAYGDNVMYKTTAYGENVYSWLVIVDKNEAFTVATAEANIKQASATAEEVKQSYDVNETGVVDINDAQLTYDIYSGKYTDFEKVSVRKFLRADVNLDKAVNSTDAVAVVKNSK